MSDVQEMQIYGIIARIEDALENSPKPKLGGGQGNKRLVDIDEIVDLLGDLKVTIPDDIRRANSVIIEAQNRMENADQYAADARESADSYAEETVQSAKAQGDMMVNEAGNKAQQIIEHAKQEYERMVCDDEIYKEAQKRAQLLAMKAEHSATEVFENAKVYADGILSDMERFIDEYRQLVALNRKDLGARVSQPEKDQSASQTESVPYTDAPRANISNSESVPQTESEDDGARRSRRVVAQPLPSKSDEEDDEFYDDDEYDDEDDEGSLFSWFKRKRKNHD